MDYLEIARARQSCRAYDATRPVEEEKLLPAWRPPAWLPLPATPSPITSLSPGRHSKKP